MRELQGLGVGSGIAVAPIVKMSPPLPDPDDIRFMGDIAAEQKRVREASEAVVADLERRVASASEEAAEILNATALMAADPVLMSDIDARIARNKTGERAVWEAIEAFADTLRQMGGYMAERAGDLADVSARIRAVLQGVPAPSVPVRTEPFILVAPDLAPADTAVLDFSVVKGLITEGGGPTGHTAIIARGNGIPALVGVAGCMDMDEDAVVIADAAKGIVIVDPSPEQVEEAQMTCKNRAERLAFQGPAAFSDGEAVELLANVGSANEGAIALEQGAQGIGLFRTEFVFLDSDSAPSLEAQTKEYRALFSQFSGKKVVVRTLDAGADKPLPYLNPANEPNPALGERGYRSLSKYPHISRTQLDAISAAARESNADVWVMAPMIADAREASQFYGEAKEAGLNVVGVMAEIPSVAIVADQVFSSCDFVSIGTNDLTQYLMAADRLLGGLGSYQSPWHPAVLRLVKMLGEAAERAGKPLGVCGEAAADPHLAPILIALGATSLSAAPTALPEVRWGLSQTTRSKAQQAAEAACKAMDATEARRTALTLL